MTNSEHLGEIYRRCVRNIAHVVAERNGRKDSPTPQDKIDAAIIVDTAIERMVTGRALLDHYFD